MSIFTKPRVSPRATARSTAAIGIFARRYAMPCRFASDSFKPTRASSGSVNIQNGMRRSRVVRLPPFRLSRTTRKSSKATCVNCGLPAQSPIAQTPAALVSKRSFTLIYPRASRSTPAASRPIPWVLGVRPVAISRSVPSIFCCLSHSRGSLQHPWAMNIISAAAAALLRGRHSLPARLFPVWPSTRIDGKCGDQFLQPDFWPGTVSECAATQAEAAIAIATSLRR